MNDASEEYFTIDREPKAEHAEDAKDRILQTIGGWRGAAKLAWRYRKVMTS
jgi:electron transfer flavoprotein-quinone oxidoreductase